MKTDARANQPIAHVKPLDGAEYAVHDLAEHLRSVADLAAEFSAPFGGEDWARQAGLWHDLGKYRRRFQNYIRHVSGYSMDAHITGEMGRAPHSTAGAMLACDRFGEAGRVLAYLIAGHHAGLADWNTEASSLAARLQLDASRTELDEALEAGPPTDILDSGRFIPELRSIPGGPAQERRNPLGFALWVRMLFSSLVDADFLDTETFMDAGSARRRSNWPGVPDLLAQYESYMNLMLQNALQNSVNCVRALILGECRTKACAEPGLFSLTVPTGGGKTLASMAFALKHAERHGQRRIIYVIPYTSIIEQTADVFRQIFGGAVIEHHSNAEVEPDRETAKGRLACENWDAPIVVTTSVQFFESLFAARTSRCRKLHNIVNSVVVLDEAQLLPADFLQPVLDTLDLLARYYKVTAVLSTATQPALATRDYFDPRQNLRGLENVREIIANPDDLYRQLKRVAVELPRDWNSPTSWPELAEQLALQATVLVIVNTRKHARELHRVMPDGTLHLSALMCGAHRSELIHFIKARLQAGEPTRVVSTQLVEAGVDLDFPVVYRAMAGLDSIAQAAGRCNREGRLATGTVVVFTAPEVSPPGFLRKGEDACRSVLHGHQGDPLDRALFARYFERLYYATNLDAEDIAGLLEVDRRSLAISFRTAAERFKLIRDEDTVPVVVLYRGADGSDTTIDTLLGKLRKDGPERWLMRKLQRYTVMIHRRDALRLLSLGDLQELLAGLCVQVNDLLYDPLLGLNPDANACNPSDLIV